MYLPVGAARLFWAMPAGFYLRYLLLPVGAEWPGVGGVLSFTFDPVGAAATRVLEGSR